MINFFRKYRTKEDLKAIADAKPKGIHHTVKFTSSYNETWGHIWEEIKTLNLSEMEDQCFVSEEIFSYDAALKEKRSRIEHKIYISQNKINKCRVVKWDDSSLVPHAFEQQASASNPHQPLEEETTETQYAEVAPLFEAKEKSLELMQEAEEMSEKIAQIEEYFSSKQGPLSYPLLSEKIAMLHGNMNGLAMTDQRKQVQSSFAEAPTKREDESMGQESVSPLLEQVEALCLSYEKKYRQQENELEYVS